MSLRALLQVARDTYPITPDHMRFICNMTLLAAHECNVERMYMVGVINLCAEIQSLLYNMESGGRMKHLLEEYDAERPTGPLVEQLDALGTQFGHKRSKLLETLAELAQVPTDDDTIH